MDEPNPDKERRRRTRRAVDLLPFGREAAVNFRDTAVVSERLTAKGSATIEYQTRRSSPKLGLCFSVASSESVRLTAMASTPMGFSASGSPSGLLMLALAGRTTTSCDGRLFSWGQRSRALYLPPGGCNGESGPRVAVGIDIAPERLETVAHVMVGAEDRERLIDFTSPRTLNLRIGNIDLNTVFMQYIAMLDAMGSDPIKMERSGLSDMITRMVVHLMRPNLLLLSQRRWNDVPRHRADLVFDYIEANLAEKLTLTELERISGLTARSLQYHFRTTTGRTPIQWITDRRLEKVHELITTARPGMTVSGIASMYFTNMGNFARLYRERYGDLPSEALARAQQSRFRT